MNQSKKLERIW